MKYEIVRDEKAEALVEFCFKILENNGVKKLPVLRTGERQIIWMMDDFEKSITMESTGEKRGCFILYAENKHQRSAEFKY